MIRYLRQVAWMAGIGMVVAGLPWVAQRLTAQEDIPRYLRRSKSVAAGSVDETPAPAELSPAPRLREGLAVVNVVGSFLIVGERLAFHADDGRGPFPVLENLMRERVERLSAETGERTWIVSGVLTEYGGHNYLLLQRAVMKADGPQNGPATPGLAAQRS